MWLSKRELRRILAERDAANTRAIKAEERLEVERSTRDLVATRANDRDYRRAELLSERVNAERKLFDAKMVAFMDKAAKERAEQYKLHLNMMDRFFTNQVKTYAVSPPTEEEIKARENPLPLPPLTQFQESEREQFGQFAVEQGLDREDGYKQYERKLRGELMPYEQSN